MEFQIVNPLIFTLALEPEATAFFNELRKQHFPKAINYLNAHLTLFHKLPGDQPQAMEESHSLVSSCPGFPVTTTGMLNLGRGVAFRVASESLEHLRSGLKQIWQPWLEAQDNHKFRAHITIQNKVQPKDAHALFESLSSTFNSMEVRALGINCYEYLEGPWKFITHISFSDV